jgi:hypothetical protein
MQALAIIALWTLVSLPFGVVIGKMIRIGQR